MVLVNNLAGLYKDQNRYLEAEPLLVEALAQRRATATADSEAVAVGELNLAELYRLQGRFDEAAPLYDSALGLARRRLGADNPNALPYLAQASTADPTNTQLFLTVAALQVQARELAALRRELDELRAACGTPRRPAK